MIVSADDLGSNEDRDRGIFLACERGLVTSVSLLANGQSFESAVKFVKGNNVAVGVHLNIADGLALTGELPGLTNPAGELPGKEKLRQSLAAGDFDQTAVRCELKAQIERILNAGLQPDHIDSHQHSHLFPCLTNMIIDLAKEYRITAMRNSLPLEAETQDPQGALGKELASYRHLARSAGAAIRSAGLRTPGGLWGMPLLNNLDTTSLCQRLEDIPAGFWELMTHPGFCCKRGGQFDGRQREIELEALLSQDAHEIIKKRNIQMITFGDLP